jgi:hypothetical protein
MFPLFKSAFRLNERLFFFFWTWLCCCVTADLGATEYSPLPSNTKKSVILIIKLSALVYTAKSLHDMTNVIIFPDDFVEICGIKSRRL